MDPYIADWFVRTGAIMITVPVGYLLYRATAYFWNNSAYLDAHGSSPEEAEGEVINRMLETKVLK